MGEVNTNNKSQKRKGIFLFLAFVLPIGIFLFLKFFGKNEFDVEPLFTAESPQVEPCFPITYTYMIPDSVVLAYPLGEDSLLLLHFGTSDEESIKQINRIKEKFSTFPVRYEEADSTELSEHRKKCIFLMRDPKDIVLTDRRGRIRGQYVSSDREDMDRLITEVTIILKRY